MPSRGVHPSIRLSVTFMYSKQLADEASRFHLGRQRQHSAVICSGALLFSSRVLRLCLAVWSRSAHTSQVDVQLNSITRLISGTHHSHLVCDPTIRQTGFDLPRQQWSLRNRFRMEQGHCGACRRKWRLTDTDLCPCGETQTMSHIAESCPLTKLNGGLSRLHSTYEDTVSWLSSYGS